VQAAGVDPARAADRDGRPGRGAQHERVELLAAGLGVLLGVVQPRERSAVGEGESVEVEQDRGGDKRARQRPAAGLVGARDEAPLELAVEGEQLAAARAGRLGAARAQRGGADRRRVLRDRGGGLGGGRGRRRRRV
jgi:hypothetical protein